LSTVRSRLTALSIPTRKDGRHLDGQGLYLEVAKDGKSRRFLLRFTSPKTHRATEAGLGTWPATSLADARAKASEYRSSLAKGIDPIVAKREARAADLAQQKGKTTFEDALDAYVKAFADRGAATIELEALLKRHVSTLMTRPLASITSNDVLIALHPTQARLPKTAAKARAAISVVFDFADAKGMFNGANPARKSVFKFLLPPPPKSVPHRMCPIDDVPALFARLQDSPSAAKLCLAFLIACSLRTQEALRCEWDEIDLDKGLLVIPAPKMKARREFRVPLSDVAHDILMTARDLFSVGKYAFPGSVKGSPLHPRTLQNVIAKQLRAPYSVHGMRAAFSTWGHERTEFPHELIELALAHEEGRGNMVARAYNRADAIERRRALMNAWGNYMTGVSASNVVQFTASARP
jgi:integrase